MIISVTVKAADVSLESRSLWGGETPPTCCSMSLRGQGSVGVFTVCVDHKYDLALGKQLEVGHRGALSAKVLWALGSCCITVADPFLVMRGYAFEDT